MELDVAQEISQRGHLPPSREVLTVRLYPKSYHDLTIHVLLDYDLEEPEERSFPGPAAEGDAPVDVQFLFVCGGPIEPGEEPEFPGIHVVDISEGTDDGFAPALEFRAMQKRPKALPVEPSAGCELRLCLALCDPDLEPFPGEDYVVSYEGGERTGTTDDEGVLREGLPAGTERATLSIAGETFELLLDQLDPLDDDDDETAVKGAQARLTNLGYDLGPVDGDHGDRTRAALEEFQAARGLEVTGSCDEATRASLAEAHGG
jgi:hypothetical protein